MVLVERGELCQHGLIGVLAGNLWAHGHHTRWGTIMDG